MTMTIEQPQAANGNGSGEIQRQTAERTNKMLVADNGEFASLLDTGRFEQLWRVAVMFSRSQIVPSHFQGQPENCFIASQMAMRMGVDPFMFMQNTYIVHGRPGMEAKLAIALINSSGLFEDSLDYEIVGEDPAASGYRVRAFAVRKTTGKTVYGPWLDWKIVKAERWDGKDGSKWKTMPGLMFQYRAAAWFGRLHCPERLMGMQTADEIEDAGASGVMPVVSSRGVKGLLSKITKKGVSEGQTFEAAPEALEEAQRSEANESPATDPLETLKKHSAPQSEHSELPADNEAVKQGDEGGQQAPAPATADEVSTVEAFIGAIESVGIERFDSPELLHKWLDKRLVLVGKKGKVKDTSQDWRLRILNDLRAGKLD